MGVWIQISGEEEFHVNIFIPIYNFIYLNHVCPKSSKLKCWNTDDNTSKSVLASTRLEDPSKKELHPTEEDGQIGTNHSLPLERGALFNRFFGKPAHGPPHVAGGASGPIGGCRDESRTDNPDLDLRHVFDRNNQKTDLI